ncbi:MAG: peroxiredoxin [Gemmatimonadales bacterium]|nr:peroxiredoxin [Gemmatimonadales bacterium]
MDNMDFDFVPVPLVSTEAPDFTATAVMPNNTFKDDFKLSDFRGKYVVMFFYPLDFTFVCPSEIIAFNKQLEDFKSRNVEVIGVSTDSHFSHLAWKNTPVENGGIGDVQYPLVADFQKVISQDYGLLMDGGMALRGTFLIDKDGIVQHSTVNNLGLGRNIDEMIRLVDALQHLEENGEVCPANWTKGDDAMAPTAEGVAKYLSEHK